MGGSIGVDRSQVLLATAQLHLVIKDGTNYFPIAEKGIKIKRGLFHNFGIKEKITAHI